ncbi:MAG: serine/threonine-protein kinase, partial [Planctomycetales bacterium]
MSNRTDPLAATNVFSEESPQATQASGPSVAEARTEAAPGDDAPSQAVALPPQIGRYRVEAVLGTGGFGSVYRAFDEQLGRQVAIKVPDPRLLGRGVQAETYLREARLVAQLDHRHIVPVYDVGGTDEFPCFVVSRLMTGGDLAAKIQTARPGARESAQLVASIAAALHHAHKQGVAHRDIKPGNILLDDQGLPMLADFGLALDETTFGTGPALAGTPAYMSPEQARGEGHRVDGRS